MVNRLGSPEQFAPATNYLYERRPSDITAADVSVILQCCRWKMLMTLTNSLGSPSMLESKSETATADGKISKRNQHGIMTVK
jgi:hypothetical protein